MGDLNVETQPRAPASCLSLLLLLILLLQRCSGKMLLERWILQPWVNRPLFCSCGCSGKRLLMIKCVLKTRKRERKDSDLASWEWESTKGRDNKQVLLHRTAQRCAASPVCDTENDSRAEVFPDPPVMEICLVPLRRLSFAKTEKHDPRRISTGVFLHCFEQPCDNHLCEHPLWHWPVPDKLGRILRITLCLAFSL